MQRRGIIIGVLGLAVVAIAVWVVSYFDSTYKLGVSYTHASNVAVTDPKTNKVVAKVNASGDTVRLDKKKTLNVTYKGDEGYASDPIEVKFENKDLQTVSIEPYFSKEKLASLLPPEQDAIRKVITDAYPATIGQYFINQGELYHFGEWYGTTLTYNGGDFFYYDNLRLAMKKEDGGWKLMSQPPMPGLTIFNTPYTPVDVLTSINHQL